MARDLRRLGVEQGDSVLLHASMRSLGRVIGGPTAVILALRDAVGAAGTLVVPAQTLGNREPAARFNRRIPARYLPYMCERLTPFDPAVTPSSGMGVIAERLRRWPGAPRSDHPQTSFAAIGAAAEEIMAGHMLDSELGEASPLAKLESRGGKALMLGVGYDRFTSFHLAEYRLPDLTYTPLTCLRLTPDGMREWATFRSLDLYSGDFGNAGEAYERQAHRPVRIGRVAAATARLLSIPDAVRFAQAWFAANRVRS